VEYQEVRSSSGTYVDFALRRCHSNSSAMLESHPMRIYSPLRLPLLFCMKLCGGGEEMDARSIFLDVQKIRVRFTGK
jgi:hypothetical protein